MSAFERALEEKRFADQALVQQEAIRVAEAGCHPLVGLPIVLLDVRPRTALEASLIAALVKRTQAACATFHAAEDAHLFEEVSPFFENVQCEEPTSQLAQLRPRLFTGDESARASAPTPDGSFTFFSSPWRSTRMS